jgi:Ferritin-like
VSDDKPFIFPRNLTARAKMLIAGNPVNTRLEAGVGNCYPGLEYDHRNLDRRFFPGLVVEFVSQDDATQPDPARRGAKIVAVEPGDAELSPPPKAGDARRERAVRLRAALANAVGTIDSGSWFIEEIHQGGVDIALRTEAGDPLDGIVVWRLVRSLLSDNVALLLRDRAPRPQSGTASALSLEGWRRRFTDPVSGVIPSVYRPGELTQSLCSPWQHDFRDCGCHYWASNHPDIVLGENRLDDPVLPNGLAADPSRANTPLDWLRADRSRGAAAAAQDTMSANRPFQLDHYEINQRWQDLAIVLGNSEIDEIYRPRVAENADPLPDTNALLDRLVGLAKLEHVRILEYLYAYYSLRDPDKLPPEDLGRWPLLRDDLIFARQELRLVVLSEMRHLRWANQILWHLHEASPNIPRRGPELGVAAEVPDGRDAEGNPKSRPRQLRVLDGDTLASFIAVEEPSGRIDGAYAQVVATLRGPNYPLTALQLARNIVADGMEHYSRFTDMQTVLRDYKASENRAPPYLIPLTKGDPADPEVKAALEAYEALKAHLALAYGPGGIGGPREVARAREVMAQLEEKAIALAEQRGIGLPFF